MGDVDSLSCQLRDSQPTHMYTTLKGYMCIHMSCGAINLVAMTTCLVTMGTYDSAHKVNAMNSMEIAAQYLLPFMGSCSLPGSWLCIGKLR